MPVDPPESEIDVSQDGAAFRTQKGVRLLLSSSISSVRILPFPTLTASSVMVAKNFDKSITDLSPTGYEIVRVLVA